MTWDETFSQLCADWRASGPDPARMQELLSRLGHPENALHFIHVAGTNGKGSASAMISRILTEAGYRTGLYISPHLLRINERWSIDGRDISDEELADMLELLRPHILSMEDRPTRFEALTALAFLYFKRQNCDVVVLEVGLGGRLDATNAIPVPDCALIMSIGLEHTEILGDTIEQIAYEKGGIIKEGGDVVLYPQEPAAEAVFRAIVRDRHAILHPADASRLTEESFSLNDHAAASDSSDSLDASCDAAGGTEGSSAAPSDTSCQGAGAPALLQYFSYKERKHLALALAGSYQCRNACCVLEVMEVLREKGYDIPEEAIRRGLQTVRWPGRFEIVSAEPLCILDGAHNPNGVETLTDTLRHVLPDYAITFVVGVMADKNYHEMLRLAAPLAARFIAEVPDCGSDRGLHAETLASEIRRYFSGPVETAPSATAALERAIAVQQSSADSTVPQDTEKSQKQAIVCFGSLYQAAEVHEFFTRRAAL